MAHLDGTNHPGPPSADLQRHGLLERLPSVHPKAWLVVVDVTPPRRRYCNGLYLCNYICIYIYAYVIAKMYDSTWDMYHYEIISVVYVLLLSLLLLSLLLLLS